MMKKKRMIILLILLFISGCSYFGRKETASDIYTRYHQGTRGLELRFVQGAPPPIVYDQEEDYIGQRDEINILVEVRNRGAFDIGTMVEDRPYGEGYILLHGYDETIIQNLKPFWMISGFDPTLGIIPLDDIGCFGDGVEGKSKYNAEGGYTVIEFPPKPKIPTIATGCPNIAGYSQIVLPDGVDYYKPNLVATACYEYYTEASPMVCIDPDPYAERTDKACRVGGIGTALGKGAKSYVAAVEGIAGGQGAPLTITNVEEEAMPGRAQFKIYVQNTGGVEVMGLDTIYAARCGFNSLLTYRDFDYFNYIVTMQDPKAILPSGEGSWIPWDLYRERTSPTSWKPWRTFTEITKAFIVTGKQLDCDPKPPVRLDSSGRAIIYCKTAGFDFYGLSAYKTPINIKLSYGYMNSVSMPIEIRSSS